MAAVKKLVADLSKPGPHRVLRGDLAFAGQPGVVYTPEEGLGLPGIAFGHDWVTPAAGYAATLEHLASWGIVAAAPDTEKGFAPSVLNLAFDLGTTLDIITGVRLGPGRSCGPSAMPRPPAWRRIAGSPSSSGWAAPTAAHSGRCGPC